MWLGGANRRALAAALLAPFLGKLGVVLSGRQLRWELDAPFAIAHNPEPALAVGKKLLGVTARDEPNIDGASGDYIEPMQHAKDMCRLKAALPEHWISCGGLAPKTPSRLAGLLQLTRFDDPYFEVLMDPKLGCPTELHSLNSPIGPRREIQRVLSTYPGRWIITAIPIRPARGETVTWPAWIVQSVMNFLKIGFGVGAWCRLSEDPQIAAVAFWCLLETTYTTEDGRTLPQDFYGIWKPTQRGYQLTTVGRALWRHLFRNRNYPIVPPQPA